MRKVYSLLVVLTLLSTIANAQYRRLVWRAPSYATSNFDVSSTNSTLATSFLYAGNWRAVDPTTNVESTITGVQNYDTLEIQGATVRFNIDYDLTSLTNIVLVLGTPRSGQNYTMRLNTNMQLLLHSTARVSIKSGGALRAQQDNSSTIDTWLKIGGVEKIRSNASADVTMNGPASASSTTPTATAAFQTAGFIMGTLPVVLVSFDAVKQSNGVALSWKTQQESNTSFFAIEKSTDGMSYSEIARVAAAGNASTPRSYSYTDAAALKGMAYYRVRIVDLDGKTGLTMVKAVRATASAAKVSLYPNPAVSVANLVVDNPESLAFGVNVFNRNGQLVARKNAAAGATAVALEVSSFPAGDYMIDVQFSNGTRQSTKLIVASH